MTILETNKSQTEDLYACSLKWVTGSKELDHECSSAPSNFQNRHNNRNCL